MAKASGGVSALARAVRILDAFHEGVRDLTATQVAERAGMPLSTVHRLLGDLVDLGLLERQGDRGYRIGLRLWELAVRTPGALGIREIARPFLLQAHAAIGQSVQLGILQGTDVLYLERLSAPRSVVNFVVVGGRLPWYATSSGLVLAAYEESETRAALLASSRPVHAFEPALSSAQLQKVLLDIRRRGHMTTPGYIHPDATSVAVPIKGVLGGTVAAISAIVPTASPREARVLEVLLPTSAAITRALRRTYGGRYAPA